MNKRLSGINSYVAPFRLIEKGALMQVVSIEQGRLSSQQKSAFSAPLRLAISIEKINGFLLLKMGTDKSLHISDLQSTSGVMAELQSGYVLSFIGAMRHPYPLPGAPIQNMVLPPIHPFTQML